MKNKRFLMFHVKKITKKFCFTRNIFYFCGNIDKGSVENT